MEDSSIIKQKIDAGQVTVNGVKKQTQKRNTVKAEGAAHNSDAKLAGTEAPDTKAVDKIADKVHEGAVKAKVAKAKKPKAPKPEAPTFPDKTKINAYGYLRIHAKVMKALGVKGAKRADGKDVFAITPAVITGYDAQTNTLSVKLGA